MERKDKEDGGNEDDRFEFTHSIGLAGRKENILHFVTS